MSGPAARPRVLVVAYCFPPDAAIGTLRTLRVVRELDARGWDVTVLTVDPATHRPGTAVDASLLEKVPSSVRVLRAKAVRPWHWLTTRLSRLAGGRGNTGRTATATVASGDRNVGPRTRRGLVGRLRQVHDICDGVLSIPDRETGWLIPAVWTGLASALRGARPDVIYASSPPWTGQLVACALQRLLRRPLVSDFRDPWGRAPWREDRYQFAIAGARWLERSVVRRANRIVFVAAANREEFSAHYGPAASARFSVVPNGCDPTEFDAARATAAPAGGPFVLLHAGTLYAGRTPAPLIRAVALAIEGGQIDRGRFRLRFLGVNALPNDDLPALCRTLGLDEVVEFVPRVPRGDSIRAMVDASGVLLLQPGHAVSVPGKIYEYMASGRPIFAIADEDGEISALVRQNGAGTVTSSSDERELADALASFVARDWTARPPVARDAYDGQSGARRIADLLAATLESRAVPGTADEMMRGLRS